MPPQARKKTTASQPESPEVLPQTPYRQARNRRAPRAADKTPTPPPPPPPRRRRRQPAPQAEPDAVPAPDAQGEPAPADANGQAPQPRAPDIFDDDPPAAPGPRPQTNFHFEDNSPGGGEFFPSPSPSPDHHFSPTSVHGRHRGSPRAGPHAPPPRAAVRQAGSRSGSAKDVWTFFEGEVAKECLICRQMHAVDPRSHQKTFSKTTSTGVLRKHLYEHHLDVWVAGCDQLKILIKAKEAKPFVDDYRTRKEHTTAGASDPKPQEKRTEFSQEAFVDAIVEFIVGDDQSINVIENKQLRAIFLMLRSELRDQDIPHRTTIRKRIIEVWDEHIITLERELGEAIGKISVTMDMWTDMQKKPYMAATGHWLQAQLVTTPFGPQYKLTLRTDLIGFMRVPGHHDGEHLATAFVYIIDRIRITHKLGWVTLDNAPNNDTFMVFLERELIRRKIPFCKFKRRIRCFPHIVNLACKAVLGAITDMDFAAPEADDFVPLRTPADNFLGAVVGDPVATIRTTVRVIRASSLRRQYFSEILKALQQKDLQLLRDVDTRWSSTLLMIDRAILLREAIDKFLSDPQFRELRKYKLGDEDWKALELFKRILAVPHAFQQKLSAEKTPTLGDALPAFEAMIKAWEKQQAKYPDAIHIIQMGINKLGAYRDRVEGVPAYVFAMIINPAVKLSWFENNHPERIPWARELFINELRGYRTILANTPARPAHNNWADQILGLDTPGRDFGGQSLEDEVRTYLMEGAYHLGSVRYWEENQLRYPTVFAFALDILPIQGSAVPCERVFSSSAQTDTDRRNNIAPGLMEALQMLKFSIKKGRGLNFTAGTSREAELDLMELVIADTGLVPEDTNGFNTFLQSLLEAEYDSE